MSAQQQAVQARAAAGGLQAHSLGTYYPWTPVGRGQDGLWEVHNLQTGQAVYFNGKVWQSREFPIAEALLWCATQGHLPIHDGFNLGPAPKSDFERAREERDFWKPAGSYALRAQDASDAIDAVVD